MVLAELGKGLHAKDGKAKIRPALEKLCQEYVRDFTFTILYSHPWWIIGAALHTIRFPRMMEFLLSIVDAESFLNVMFACKLRLVLCCITMLARTLHTVVAYSCCIYH
jgi:hypothetical protein